MIAHSLHISDQRLQEKAHSSRLLFEDWPSQSFWEY